MSPQTSRVCAQSPRAPLQACVCADARAEGVTKTELLAIRFGTPENAALFKARAPHRVVLRLLFADAPAQEHFGKAQKLNEKLEGGASGGGSAAASPASTPSKEGAREGASP